MFECRACALRCFEAIIGQSAPVRRSSRFRSTLSSRVTTTFAVRGLTSIASTRGDGDASTSAVGDHETGSELSNARGGVTSSLSASQEKALRLELQYLQDPVKLADHVHYTLRCDRPEKALELCRLAGKEMDCIVAWNHTIDWHMQKGKVSEAFRIYNEMKKRAQWPDSYTYMMLLRGFPQHRTHHGPETRKSNVSRAMALFDSMGASNSKVKPNIKHTNAALRVCSIAKDMDALWSLAGKLPSSGANSADQITYTILLGAIRCQDFGVEQADVDADSDGKADASHKVIKMRQNAVDEGRRIWQEIIARWRRGEIILDHSLVCEMASLLLLSGRLEDCDDVLNLVHQTMNIPRTIPPLGSPGRKAEHIPRAAGMVPPSSSTEDSEGWTPASSAKAFHAQSLVPDSLADRPSHELACVQPDNDVLNCVLEACSRMRTPKAVYAYWDAFVNERGLRPDLANFHTLLEIMRINRNSGKAAGLLRQMHELGLTLRNRTFRTAMSVCSRDVKNINVVENATTMVDIMGATLPSPDFHTLGVYFSIAASTKDVDKIVAALHAIDPAVKFYRARAASGKVRSEDDKDESDEQDAIHLFTSMVSTMNMLERGDFVSGDSFRWLMDRRSELDGILNRANNNFHLQRERQSIQIRTRGQSVEQGGSFRRVRPPALSMGKAAWDARLTRYRGRRTMAVQERP